MMMNNSPTVQNMINSVTPGMGNIPYVTGSANPTQFQTPYPSPMEMVRQSGYMQYMNPNMMQMYPQQMMYPQPYMQSQMPMYQQPTGYPSIQQINQQPVDTSEYEEIPQLTQEEIAQKLEAMRRSGEIPQMSPDGSYVPRNPRVFSTVVAAPAGLDPNSQEGKEYLSEAARKQEEAYLEQQQYAATPKPGRYMSVQPTIPTYAQAVQQRANIVGAYNPMYGQVPQYAAFQQPMSMPMIQQPQQQDPQIYGTVDIYNGQTVHPHVEHTWYGSKDFPFVQSSKEVFQSLSYADKLRDKFKEKFPGYTNPYAPPGFMQGSYSQQYGQQISPEVQDMANIAAFYGMSYNDFMKNSSEVFKLMSKCVNKSLGNTDEVDIAKKSKIYDFKNPLSKKPGQIPDNDEELFYPDGAFDMRGQLTNQYLYMFCVNKRFKQAKKKLKVALVVGDEVIEGKPRPIDHLRWMDKLAETNRAEVMRNQYLFNNKIRFAQMHESAVEKQIDAYCSNENVFEVTAKTLAVTKQKEMDDLLLYQTRCGSSQVYNHNNFIRGIKDIFYRNRQRQAEINKDKWTNLVNKVITDDAIKESISKIGSEGDFTKQTYLQDGDWIIAKPGKDIVGLDLDVSVNKIVRMNTVTGEEEIYDPDAHLTGMEVRARIQESANKVTSFEVLTDDEIADRLERFRIGGFD